MLYRLVRRTAWGLLAYFFVYSLFAAITTMRREGYAWNDDNMDLFYNGIGVGGPLVFAVIQWTSGRRPSPPPAATSGMIVGYLVGLKTDTPSSTAAYALSDRPLRDLIRHGDLPSGSTVQLQIIPDGFRLPVEGQISPHQRTITIPIDHFRHVLDNNVTYYDKTIVQQQIDLERREFDA